MKLSVLNSKGKKTGREVTLPKSVFNIEPNDHALYLDVKQFLAHQRQGTHKAKERADINGSTRKIKKQKGTGTARAGSKKSGLFRGGGRIFGPRPRDYDIKLNRKLKKLARKSALSIKAKENAITIIEDFEFKSPKTKTFIDVLRALNIDSNKSLFVFDTSNINVYLSSRNFKGTEVITTSEMNTYSILNAKQLVISESSLLSINENLSK
jgi:large subunit ribosomal protein L4|tara:strand:+ start:214 stop:843 length:630 start_codon:yes stop_codon:yes gene_type:complete